MKKTEKTTVKSVRMNESLANTINNLAKEQNRNFSNMAETLLIKSLDCKQSVKKL